MGKNVYYFLFLLWLSYLIISSVLLFAKGFLLTRQVQNYNSTCLAYDEIPCTQPDSTTSYSNITNGQEDQKQEQCSYDSKLSTVLRQFNSASNICLPPKAKVVLIIIDALRYDFTLYDEKLQSPLAFQNKMPVINTLLQKYPDQTRLYKFLADPPTTTLQRLKGLTTGSLPTFIDAGANFESSEILEDNIIDQLVKNNKTVVFMGDDTWTGLYPRRFTREYHYPSFNVWDLDTVDNGVRKNLEIELKNKDWDLLIGHFLGVDHCGHTYGPNHGEMSRKLIEMNAVLENVSSNIDDDVMLFVIGDHGMTSHGNHGSDSDDEVSAALFVYSKQPLLPVLVDSKLDNSVKQVDLVPTLSIILGVPIPFQNLGSLILNCLPITNKTEIIEEWQLTLYSLWANVQQMVDYIKVYSKSSKIFNEQTLQEFFDKYSILNGKVHTTNSKAKFEMLSKELIEYLESLRDICMEIWVQYDSFSMARGLLFMFLSTFFVYIIIDGIPVGSLPEIFQSSFLLCSYVALFIASAFAAVLYYFELVDHIWATIFFATGVVSQFMLVMLVIQNWEVISLNWYDKSKKQRIPNLICRLILILNISGLFSNSYVVEEGFVLMFLLVTIIFLGVILIIAPNYPEKRRNGGMMLKWSKIKLGLITLAVAFLVRSSPYFWRCREEQHWCSTSSYDIVNSVNSKVNSKIQWCFTTVCLIIFTVLSKVWLKRCGNLNGFSVTVTLARFSPMLMVFFTSSWWIYKNSSQIVIRKITLQNVNVFAWAVYAFGIGGIITTVINPLYTYLLPKDTNVRNDQNIVPQLFKQVKESLLEKDVEEDVEVPIVCGLGTVYSAPYIVIGTYLVLLFSLLLGASLAPSAIIMFLTAICVLIFMSVIRIDRTTSIENLFDTQNMCVLAWVILSQYFFYGTGHQPTFPNIQWETAFIGTKGMTVNNFVSATLIIINTYCSHILMGFLLPLIIITPFSLFIMMPSIVGKKKELQSAFHRGEVFLYEWDNLMITNAFILSCKYILFHAVRIFASMLSASILCRHLMVWKIFAPKFIFESIGMLITLISVVASFLLLLRINKKVENLVINLNKLR